MSGVGRAELDADRLEVSFINKDNVAVLEGIIDDELQESIKVHKLAIGKKITLGTVLPRHELYWKLIPVFEDISRLLSSSPGNYPRADYFPKFRPKLMLNRFSQCYEAYRDSHYSPVEGKIWLPRIPEKRLVIDAGHEDSHYLQSEGAFGSQQREAREGHARGVEKLIARRMSQRTDDPAYLLEPLRRSVGELWHGYGWLCESLGTFMNSALVNELQRQDGRAVRRHKTHYHARGNTIFSTLAARHGNKIYSDALSGKLDFLKA